MIERSAGNIHVDLYYQPKLTVIVILEKIESYFGERKLRNELTATGEA